MDIKDYSKKFVLRKISAKQELAAEIYEFFRKELSFPRIMKIIGDKGVQATRETFTEISKCEFPHKLPLFIKKVKDMKIIWVKN